jgi:cell wall-associated NlpC family hydrolase
MAALARLVIPALLLSLGACASAPGPSRSQAHVEDNIASHAADVAASMTGKPYRYGGDTPAGFDCSGLVRYSYARTGVELPRETSSLRLRASRISISGLRRGDLLFFDQEGKKFSHVGIYLGDGRFVHAPSTGGRVRTDRLDADYWQRHLVEARRI